jgi:hypothetical protein
MRWTPSVSGTFGMIDAVQPTSLNEAVEFSGPAALLGCSGYIDAVMIQDVLDDPANTIRLGQVDLRAFHALIWSHITPYGTFNLDLARRFALST